MPPDTQHFLSEISNIQFIKLAGLQQFSLLLRPAVTSGGNG
ncbi:hypothetical protein [Endozoicomonas sp. ONNA2]|nr:hypothetical protein [Endozoicomonas sp. ONNA2]